ncbi:MAG: AMP-binding protein [Spirochaetaceae bacterium]|jgi:acetyl-CoA synthetase|nr:AMP-binding protein [Spirochaetaceae bacterium]
MADELLKRFCPRLDFDSYEDFYEHYRCVVPEQFNFAFDVVDAWAALQPDKLALLWTDDTGTIKRYTFADLKRLSDKAANALLALGITKGTVVMLILKQRPEVWVLMTALMKIGAVCIPGTYQLTEKDIAYRCRSAEVALLITIADPPLLANIQTIMPTCPNLRHCAVVASPADLVMPPFIDMCAAIDRAAPEFEPPCAVKTSDPMLIYFSSGTTGMPKMVRHNFSFPLGHIVTAKYWQCVEDNGVHLTQSDSGWAKFAWGKLYGQWLCGAAVGVYDTEKFTPQGIIAAVQRLKPVSFCAPATIFRFLIKEDLSAYDFSFIKHTTVAGEPLSPEVFYRIKEMTGLEIREGFGQSESSVLVAVFKWLPVKPGSMGKPAPLYDVELLDETDSVCDDGLSGMLSITAADRAPPGLFTDYWKDEALTKAVWYGGIYRSGDMAWRDAEGYYWFVGRNDDVIKCSGYRIGPFEVESALMEHPAVLECAVTAAPDPLRGSVVKATVVLARGFSGSDSLKRELQNHVKRVTAPYKYPRIIVFVDELPKTASGKIQRSLIRAQDTGQISP